MDVVFREKFLWNVILLTDGTNIADSRLCRFLHHIAELSGQLKLAFSRHHIDFDFKGITADARPSKPAHDSNLIVIVLSIKAVSFFSKVLSQILLCDFYRLFLLTVNLTRRFSGNFAELALQAADPRFSRITGNNPRQRLVAYRKLVFFQSVAKNLLL